MIDYSVQNKKRHILRTLMFAFFLCVAVVISAAAVAYGTYRDGLKAAGTDTETKLFVVEAGSTAHDIAIDLEQDGLIRRSWVFEWYVRINGLRDDFLAGSYELSPSQSTPEIVANIVEGNISKEFITILPGQRIDQIKEMLLNSGFSASEVDVALNPRNYSGHPALEGKPEGGSLEGYIYPETFQRTTDTKPESIIRQSLDLMDQQLTSEIRAGFARQGLTPYEAIVVASIVEKEVNNLDDAPIVAQVFLKRLRDGMVMGSDVTARYGAVVDGVDLPENSAEADSIAIAHDSPYNTRIYPGLPPGPISNVSAQYLRAVAFPASTDYLYFVAGDDGKTYFSRTLAEHEAAVSAHCFALCGR